MKKRFISILFFSTLFLATLFILPTSAHAETDGVFTYEIYDGEIQITGCDPSASGEIVIPSKYEFWEGYAPEPIAYPVTTICFEAFKNCSEITDITIPSSIKLIWYDAFEGCTNLERVHISDIAVWSGIEFGNGPSNPLSCAEELLLNGELVTELSFPETLTSIGDYAFYNYAKLTDVSFHDGITKIGKGAFENCVNITHVNTTNLSSWCTIDFADEFSNPTCYAKNLYKDGQIVRVVNSLENITKIGDYTFYNCKGLLNFVIPDGVTTIGEKAFCLCDNLIGVTIPSTVKSIYNEAFGACSGLNKLNITDIAAWCEIKYYDDPVGYISDPLYFARDLYLNGKLITKLIIPEGVTDFGSAFRYCESITEVYIPEGVTDLGSFQGCVGITTITIPSTVQSIAVGAFQDCTNLTKVNITDLAAWCNIEFDYQFEESSNPIFYTKSLYLNDVLITDLVIPDGVTRIGDYAFFGCQTIKSVSIPESVTSIGIDAFRDCSELKKVNIENTAPWCNIEFETKKSNPLYYAKNLYLNDELITDIEIPKSAVVLNKYAFYDCQNIKTVTIHNSLLGITEDAFYNCTGIENVYFTGTEDEWDFLLISSGNDAIDNAEKTFEYGKFSVTYLLCGGENGPKAEQKEMNADIHISEVTPVRDNHSFLGWSTTKNGTVLYKGGETYSENEGLTLYAIWEDNSIPYVTCKTERSDEGTLFDITPVHCKEGDYIIVATYKGNAFVDITIILYDGTSKSWETSKDFDNAKAFIWDGITTMKPLCTPIMVE